MHCRRRLSYYAKDLYDLYGDERIDSLFGGKCSKCGSGLYWWVRERWPSSDDVGHTLMRRPAGLRKVQLWKNEFYGPQPEPEKPSGSVTESKLE